MPKVILILFLLSLLQAFRPHEAKGKEGQRHSASLDKLLEKSIYYQHRRPELAMEFARKGFVLAHRIDDRDREAAMLRQLASLNEQYNHADLAIKYQTEALQLLASLRNRKTAEALLALGNMEGRRMLCDNAMSHLYQAQQIFSTLRLPMGIMECEQAQGNVALNCQDDQKAQFYFDKAVQTGKNLPASALYLGVLLDLAAVFNRSGNPGKALELCREGLKRSEDSGLADMRVLLLANAGHFSSASGDFRRAENYHQQAWAEAKAAGLYDGQAKAQIDLAKLYKKTHAARSLKALYSALTLARRSGDYVLVAEAYKTLSLVYRQQHDFKKALFALEIRHHLLDSLAGAAIRHEAAITKGNLALQEAKIKVQNVQLTNEKKLLERNTWLIALSFILLILAVGGGFFYRSSVLNKRLAQSNAIKDQLFSIIGHDLRNPIGGITQMLTLLEEEQMSGHHRELMGIMRKQGQVALDILNALLNWGKAQLQGIVVNPLTFHTKPVIAKNLELLHTLATEKELTIMDYTSTDLRIYGDPDHFDFIIRNLLSNAIKFSFRGGNISVKAHVWMGQGRVVFCVKDQGIGISLEKQRQFSSRNMDMAYGTSGEKGTGIGLLLSKEFAKVNRGKIWVESQPGKGSTFLFSFPQHARPMH